MQRISRPIIFRIAALAAATFLAACNADSAASVAAPDTQRSNGLVTDLVGGVVNTLVPVKALMRTNAVAAPIQRAFKVTKVAGGTILIPETGLRVDVPSNAIDSDSLTITVTALAGRAVAYDFQPHGTQFLKPLVFRQSLTQTTWAQSLIKPALTGGYFANTSQVNPTTGSALLNEVLSLNVLGNEARFNIFHFSGYMVSGGRQSSYSEEMF